MREELERIAGETDRWRDLVESFVSQAGELEFAEQQIPLYMRVGHIYYVELQENTSAIQHYRHILDLDPYQFDALDVLEELYEAEEQWELLCEIFAQKLQLLQDLDEQRDLLLRLAEVQEEQRLDRPAAIDAYRKIQSLEPNDPTALEALERLYREEQLWTDLLQVLEARVQLTTETKTLLRLRFEIGQIYHEEFEDYPKAAEAYQGILEVEPKNQDALRALERLYTDLEDWSALLEILNQKLQLASYQEEKIPLLGRMALVWEEELEDTHQAIELLKQITALDRWNIGAMKGLERLYEEHQMWEPLIEIYEQHIRAINDLEEMAELYFRVGAVYEQQFQQSDRATTYYLRVLDADPFFQPALSALGKIYEANKNWPKCIEMMEREAKVVNEPEQLVEVYFRVGKIYEEQLVQIDRAKESYKKALSIQPSYLPAIRSLKVIYFLQKDWYAV
ncbi:MAG: tetratricopeptide repeat protein, partial [Myxococcota bacterium]